MNDEHLKESLRRLPEARAGEGFTRAVLARIEEMEAEEDRPRESRAPGAGGWPSWLPLPTPRLATVLVAAMVVGLVAAPLLLNGPAAPRPAGWVETVAGGDAATPQPAEDGAEGLEMAGSGEAARPSAGALHGQQPPADQRAAVDLPAPTLPPRAPAQDPAVEGSRSGEGDDAASEAGSGNDETEGGIGGNAGTPPAPDASRPRDRAGSPAPPAQSTGGGDTRLASASGEAAPLDREAALRRLTELRRRQERLRAELAALSDTGRPGSAPALLLGGDESVELVLDLGSPRYADAGGTVRPAAAGRTAPERY